MHDMITIAALQDTSSDSSARKIEIISQRGGPVTLWPEYPIWATMRQRCSNPKDISFSYYGGRGITVCARWVASFRDFVSDMGLRPSAKYSIDRIDNDGNYEPGNCRWVTRKEQLRNRRITRWIVFGEEKCSLAEWSERTGIPRSAISKRLACSWSVADALTIPSGVYHCLKEKSLNTVIPC